MTRFLAVPLALSLFAAPAMAVPPADCSTLEGEANEKCNKAAVAAAEATEAMKRELEALGDCSDKEGDDKGACETKYAELTAKLAPAAPEAAADEGKGGKAKRSNTNRMESETEDE